MKTISEKENGQSSTNYKSYFKDKVNRIVSRFLETEQEVTGINYIKGNYIRILEKSFPMVRMCSTELYFLGSLCSLLRF